MKTKRGLVTLVNPQGKEINVYTKDPYGYLMFGFVRGIRRYQWIFSLLDISLILSAIYIYMSDIDRYKSYISIFMIIVAIILNRLYDTKGRGDSYVNKLIIDKGYVIYKDMRPLESSMNINNSISLEELKKSAANKAFEGSELVKDIEEDSLIEDKYNRYKYEDGEYKKVDLDGDYSKSFDNDDYIAPGSSEYFNEKYNSFDDFKNM